MWTASPLVIIVLALLSINYTLAEADKTFELYERQAISTPTATCAPVVVGSDITDCETTCRNLFDYLDTTCGAWRTSSGTQNSCVSNALNQFPIAYSSCLTCTKPFAWNNNVVSPFPPPPPWTFLSYYNYWLTKEKYAAPKTAPTCPPSPPSTPTPSPDPVPPSNDIACVPLDNDACLSECNVFFDYMNFKCNINLQPRFYLPGELPCVCDVAQEFPITFVACKQCADKVGYQVVLPPPYSAMNWYDFETAYLSGECFSAKPGVPEGGLPALTSLTKICTTMPTPASSSISESSITSTSLQSTLSSSSTDPTSTEVTTSSSSGSIVSSSTPELTSTEVTTSLSSSSISSSTPDPTLTEFSTSSESTSSEVLFTTSDITSQIVPTSADSSSSPSPSSCSESAFDSTTVLPTPSSASSAPSSNSSSVVFTAPVSTSFTTATITTTETTEILSTDVATITVTSDGKTECLTTSTVTSIPTTIVRTETITVPCSETGSAVSTVAVVPSTVTSVSVLTCTSSKLVSSTQTVAVTSCNLEKCVTSEIPVVTVCPSSFVTFETITVTAVCTNDVCTPCSSQGGVVSASVSATANVEVPSSAQYIPTTLFPHGTKAFSDETTVGETGTTQVTAPGSTQVQTSNTEVTNVVLVPTTEVTGIAPLSPSEVTTNIPLAPTDEDETFERFKQVNKATNVKPTIVGSLTLTAIVMALL